KILLGVVNNTKCYHYQAQYPHTILHYNILSWRDNTYLNYKLNSNSVALNCHCEWRRMVFLKNPKATYQTVLVSWLKPPDSVCQQTENFLASIMGWRYGREYAYLSVPLFNSETSPDSVFQRLSALIEGLQQEAEGALRDIIYLLHPEDAGCLRYILQNCHCQSDDKPQLGHRAFLQTGIGTANMSHLLIEYVGMRTEIHFMST
uniref:Uncharacterized protein n=1 Tax=Echeneis naucrates TaxID=173247 RepID=A0A665TMP5_ECHNA